MRTRYPVTLAIIVTNVIVFALIAWQQKSLLMNTSADVIAILNAGANLNPFTVDGQPWRILTCIFLHFGIIHLAVNMYGLWQLGTFLEPGLGSSRFTLLYFVCGFTASIASLFFNNFVISAGASGAIFGLYGYQLTAEIISTYHEREKLQRVLINFGIFVVVNAFIAGQVSIDMSGHIGGAVAGMIVAFCHFKVGILKTKTAMFVVMLACPFLLFFVPKDQVRYYDIFQRVIGLDRQTSMLLQSQRNEESLGDSLQHLSEKWKLVQSDLRNLPNIPRSLQADTAILNRYINLRLRESGYRSRVLEQSYIYLDSVETIAPLFDSLPKLKYVLNFTTTQPQELEEDTIRQQDSFSRQTPAQIFYDKNWKETDDQYSARYYRIGYRDSIGRWQGRVYDYFKNGDIQMKGFYKNNLREGVFIYYTDRHTYESAGRYEKDRYVGKWERFHWNGALEREILYHQRSYTNTIWDSLGNVLVANGSGNYRSWHSNQKLKEEGTYANGSRTGYWLGYYPDGKPYYKEFFRDNVLERGVSLGRDGKQYVYDALSEVPVPVMGFRKYGEYLRANKNTHANNLAKGVVKVLFTVGVDGSLWDFVILQSVSSESDNEAIRLVREGPPWRPALLHGQEKVLSQGYVEVSF